MRDSTKTPHHDVSRDPAILRIIAQRQSGHVRSWPKAALRSALSEVRCWGQTEVARCRAKSLFDPKPKLRSVRTARASRLAYGIIRISRSVVNRSKKLSSVA